MNGEPEDRIALNEMTARRINEAIESGNRPQDVHYELAFRCECGRFGCNQMLGVALGDYERVRANPRRFVVAPGHEDPEIETVVHGARGYNVVEKHDAAGEAAEEADPRS